ncbi:glycoside hydrolase [Lipomyces arxii]|uniref:glycoside hydrolase n=1 Tax=Lipomyces arxii TaxID=56418 RepID=UPI0034CDCC4A
MRPAPQAQRFQNPVPKPISRPEVHAAQLEVTDKSQSASGDRKTVKEVVSSANDYPSNEPDLEPSLESRLAKSPDRLPIDKYQSTYSPDDHRVNKDSITTPKLSKIANVFSTPRLIKFPAPLIPLPKDSPKALPKIQGNFQAGTDSEEQIRFNRLSVVREAFLHSWKGYKSHAWGHDELQPVSNEFADPFGGWGATIFDSLDTLQIMGLTTELEEAKRYIAGVDFTKSNFNTIPVFETTIRYLGGLISAYDLSPKKELLFLRKAVELADLLIGAFDTPNGMPVLFYDPQLAHHETKLRAGKHMIFSQFASLSLEFTRLAQITSNNTYYSAIQRVTNQIEEALQYSAIPGLWPLRMDISGCETDVTDSEHAANQRSSTLPPVPKPGSIRPSQELQNMINDAAGVPSKEALSRPDAKFVKRQLNLEENADVQARSTTLNSLKTPGPVSIPDQKPDSSCISVKGLTESIRVRSPRKFSAGALGDSAYEYFIKEYLLLGGLNTQYADLYEVSSQSIKSNLLYRPLVKGDPDILFSGNMIIGANNKKTLDLEMSHLSCFLGGMFAIGSKALNIKGDMAVAEKLAYGCYWAYNATNTGIMPENFHVRQCTTPNCHWVDPRFADENAQNLLRRDNSTSAEPSLSKRRLRKRQEFGEFPAAQPAAFDITQPTGGAPLQAQQPEIDSFGPVQGQQFPEVQAQSAGDAPIGDTPATEQPPTFPAEVPPVDTQGMPPAFFAEAPAVEAPSLFPPETSHTEAVPGAFPQSVDVPPAFPVASLVEGSQIDTSQPGAPAEQAQLVAGPVKGSDVTDLPRTESPDMVAVAVSDTADDHPSVAKVPIQVPESDLHNGNVQTDNIEPTIDHLPSSDEIEATEQAEAAAVAGAAAAHAALVDADADSAAQRTPKGMTPAPFESAEDWEDAPVSNAAATVGSSKKEALVKDDVSESKTVSAASAVTASATNGESANAWGDESDESSSVTISSSVPAASAVASSSAKTEKTDRWEIGGWYDQPRSFLSQDGRFLLRPEALESIFVLYRTTGDKIWQERGWQMFSAINKYCRTKTAYSAIKDVTDPKHIKFLDEMESFWTAETLKYAYLLFSDPDFISLDNYVFNTEAHPFLRPHPAAVPQHKK